MKTTVCLKYFVNDCQFEFADMILKTFGVSFFIIQIVASIENWMFLKFILKENSTENVKIVQNNCINNDVT